MVYSIAARLVTGSEPGSPRQTGQTAVLGGSPNVVGQPQNILVTVPSSTCVSSPITGSYRDSASSNPTSSVTLIGKVPSPVPAAVRPSAAPAPPRRPPRPGSSGRRQARA